MPDRPAHRSIAEFARGLRELRIECGEPSYTAISQLAAAHGESISVGSVNTLLKGERLTKADIVETFVRTVLRYRDGGDRPAHADVVRKWSSAWTEVRIAAITSAGEADDVPPLFPPEPLAPVAADDPEQVTGSSFARDTDHGDRRRPPRAELVPPGVETFQTLLERAFRETDQQGRKIVAAKWGCYAFYDYDGEPIYVGQTSEGLGLRLRRHLSNQRSDAVAMHILDVHEVAEVEVWPLWDLEGSQRNDPGAREKTNAVEHTVYVNALHQSRFHALLNEAIPAPSRPVELPPSWRFVLADARLRRERGDDSTRIARRAENLARLTARAVERPYVSDGLRRVILVQAARLTQLAAARFSYATGQPPISVHISGLETEQPLD
ncbi:hypothetical protein SUDANB95_06933 [Actinosynnema sp. ALI-1.44]